MKKKIFTQDIFDTSAASLFLSLSRDVCVCVCVSEREREGERAREYQLLLAKDSVEGIRVQWLPQILIRFYYRRLFFIVRRVCVTTGVSLLKSKNLKYSLIWMKCTLPEFCDRLANGEGENFPNHDLTIIRFTIMPCVKLSLSNSPIKLPIEQMLSKS